LQLGKIIENKALRVLMGGGCCRCQHGSKAENEQEACRFHGAPTNAVLGCCVCQSQQRHGLCVYTAAEQHEVRVLRRCCTAASLRRSEFAGLDDNLSQYSKCMISFEVYFEK
jgi:hypothetical protein